MRSSLKSVLTRLLPFKSSSCGRSKKQADVCASAEASRKSELLSGKEVGKMLKIGDKITVPVKIVQIVINDSGVHYVVVPVKSDNYNTMKITEKDFVE
jgi:hypothetical protein